MVVSQISLGKPLIAVPIYFIRYTLNSVILLRLRIQKEPSLLVRKDLTDIFRETRKTSVTESSMYAVNSSALD